MGTITASYWDTETSGLTTSAGGVGKTTSQLQSPTGYTGIYSDWNTDIDGNAGGDKPWDFGTGSQYPKINYVPSAPATLGAVIGDRQVTLTWATGPSILPITKYRFQEDGSGQGWQDIPGSDASTTSHTVAGLTNGQTHTFRVRAVNEVGAGPASDSVSATPSGPPCIQDPNASDSNLWAALVQAVPGRSTDEGNEDYQYTWYEYGWWEDRDGSDELCGGISQGDDTYLVFQVSASLSRLESEVYGSYTNVGVHISFERRPPKDLLDGKMLVIGDTELAFSDASNALANDGEFYYNWYTALDYEPTWWADFSAGDPVKIAIRSDQ